jgi:spore coat polysaccharide biosynthesis protein SpsF
VKTGVIIQTRMGSSRLRGKVMLNICENTVMGHVIDRMKQCKELDEIIIATTESPQDDIIIEEAKRHGVKWFRGSEDNVLSRYYYAAVENNLDVIARVTSDCPLIDPFVTDKIIRCYIDNDYDLVTNAGADLKKRTFPRGLDVEVFSINSLSNAFKNAVESYQREHVTPYLYENCEKIFYYKNDIDYSKYRWTLDTDDDLKLIEAVYAYLYNGQHNFYLNDIISLMEGHPEIAQINADVKQKSIK